MAATVRRQGPPRTTAQEKPRSKKGKGKAKECAAPPDLASKSSAEPSWHWTALTDSLVSSISPIFTKDGSYFFSLVGDSVRIYAVATGKVVSTLTPPSTAFSDVAATLTCAVLNPHNAFQLITGSDAGVLAVWDFLEARLVQIIDIGHPIHHICAHENFKETVFVSAGRPSKSESHAVVLSVSLKPADAASQSTTQKSSSITPVGKTRQPSGLAFSPSGSWLVATAGHKAYVASTTALRAGFTKYVSPERLTCLAFHPSEEYFATGDEKGNIRLWYCLTDQLPAKAQGVEKKTQTSSLHWHAHAVSSIAFTSNGAYLLSGGEESVLVIWQLHTGKREYIPRLGSPIKTISVAKSAGREEEYLLGLADATYAFVSAAALKLTRSYSRFKLDPSAVPRSTPSTSTTSTPLSVHTPTSTLILPSSHPSSLQIFSPLSGTLVSELEVSPSNRVSRRDEKPIEPCRVERVAVSVDGDWLASIDGREGDEDTHGESYLKIWSWDRKTGYWILNTRIDRPHGLERVTGLAFSASDEGQAPLLATAGADGAVKTWRTKTVKNKSGSQEEFWLARTTYNVHERPSHVSWSPDGSLLAVTTPLQIALFAPSTNQLLHTLAYPESGKAHSSHFIGKGGRYVAVVGEKEVILWDLVGLRVQSHHKYCSRISALVSHPRQSTFAIVLETEGSLSQVMVLQVEPSQSVQTISLPFGLRSVVWYPLLLSFSLVGVTHDWRVVVIGDQAHIPKDDSRAPTELKGGASTPRRTLFEDIFGKSAFSDDVAAPSPAAPSWTASAGPTSFDGFTTSVTYLMPALETLFDPLMASHLKPRVSATLSPLLPVSEPDPQEMDVDGPVITSSTPDRRTVERSELDMLVNLFQTHTLKGA
ncbi:WD40 repeat-like protein [Mycena amicta]|nr:WD40 repeat-like protein [Mycena amicta]